MYAYIGIFLFIHMETKVAIQGVLGSFHHQVSQEWFQKEVGLVHCNSFRNVVENLSNGEVEYAVLAIENSIAGTILPNYALIDNFNVNIIGEHYININMNLMALKGQKFEDIKEVHSHPIALLQCADFFSQYPHIRLVECSDTAFAAKNISENKLKGVGALAGDISAELYELDILAAGIHTVKSNTTRFVILNKTLSDCEAPNKASLKFELDDTPGSLATVLNVINNCRLNLTKIQSLPIIEKPFQYSFFIDVVYDHYNDYVKGKQLLEMMTTNFKVLGEYKIGK